jgi:phosphatidylglycerophosphatase A
MVSSGDNDDARAGSEGPIPPGRARLRFLLSHPAHWLSMGLGSGLLRPGPGTWGTALAWAIFAVLAPSGAVDPATALLFVAIALIVGTWAAEHTAAMLGEADPSTIVVDEMVAFWFVLVLLPPGDHLLRMQVFAFLLFRLFDITKPEPIGFIDRRWKSAVGVMADDLVAAFYTLLVIAIWIRVT